MNVDIDKISIAVEVKGKPYFVILPQESMQVILMAAQGLSENGKLNLVDAPEGFLMVPLEDMKR